MFLEMQITRVILILYKGSFLWVFIEVGIRQNTCADQDMQPQTSPDQTIRVQTGLQLPPKYVLSP